MSEEKECEFINIDGNCNCVHIFMYEKFKYMNEPIRKCNDVDNCYYKKCQQMLEALDAAKNALFNERDMLKTYEILQKALKGVE